MRRTRKFYQRGSNSDNVFWIFLFDEGKEHPITLKAGQQWPASITPFHWRADNGPNLNAGLVHGLQSLPPSPKRAERKGRRRPFREAGSGHEQWNTVSCVDTFSIISKFSAQNSKI